VRHSVGGSRTQVISLDRWPTNLLERGGLSDQVVRGPLPLIFISWNPQSVAFHGGHLVRAAPDPTVPANRRCAMRSKNLMSPDVLSEIVLLGVGMLIFVSLLLFIVAAFTRT
jgi:hypothetical protein